MKNNIVLYMCVFLFLSSCSSDHDTETAIKKHIDKTKNTRIDKTKKTYIDEIKNLIEVTKETIDKNKMLSIELEGQDTVDSESDEQVFNIGIRAFNFINTFLTDDEIDEFTTIFSKPTLKSPAKVLNNITILEFNLEKIINHLFLKKDVLDKIKISDLKKIKNSLEQLFSIRKIFSTAIKQLLLDYQKNRSFIKTDDSKLKTYFDVMLNRFNEKSKEANNLKTVILSISI